MTHLTHHILIPLERSLTALRGWDGWLIGSCRFLFEGTVPDAPVTCEPAAVLRQSVSLATIQNKASWAEGQACLRLLFVRPADPCSETDRQSSGARRGKRLADDDIGHSVPDRQTSLSISREELAAFLKLVPDTNPIHLGADPVLPGMLLLNRMLEWSLKEGNGIRGPLQADARFYTPLRCGQPLRLACDGSRQALRIRLDTGNGECGVCLRIQLPRKAAESSTGNDSAAMADNYARLSLHKGGTRI